MFRQSEASSQELVSSICCVSQSVKQRLAAGGAAYTGARCVCGLGSAPDTVDVSSLDGEKKAACEMWHVGLARCPGTATVSGAKRGRGPRAVSSRRLPPAGHSWQLTGLDITSNIVLSAYQLCLHSS